MKSVVAVILCLIIPTAMFAGTSQPGFTVKYDASERRWWQAGTESARQH
jgi:hypothetical protein